MPRTLSLLSFLGALVLLPLLPGLASADQSIDLKPKAPGTVVFTTSGDYRLNFSLLDDFAVDAESPATTHGQTRYLDQRLRVRFDLKAGRAKFSTEWDLLTGQLAGDVWNLGSLDRRRRDIHGAITPSGFTPRRASVLLRWADIDVEAGLMTSHWGLGMLANDGAHDPMFGRTDLADRVLRVRMTARPLHWRAKPGPDANKLMVTGALDVVFDDDAATLADGQVAMQLVGSVVHHDPGVATHGVYAVYRNQREPNDTGKTSVVVVDGYFDRSLSLGKSASLRLAGEVAGIFGSTSRALNYNARDALAVRSIGATGLVSLAVLDKKLQIHARLAYASGDDDGEDGTSTSFNFDRNFGSGSVLFDQVLGSVALASHALITDPEISGQPPRGIDALAGEGAAGSVFFFQPVLQGTPLPFLDFKGGALIAVSSGDHRQPFYSSRAGGTAQNFHDEPTDGRMLGTELNWSVTLGGDLPLKAEAAPKLAATFQIQGGHLLVGSALRAAADESQVIHHVQMTGRFRW